LYSIVCNTSKRSKSAKNAIKKHFSNVFSQLTWPKTFN
jgi:hypothetical protein